MKYPCVSSHFRLNRKTLCRILRELRTNQRADAPCLVMSGININKIFAMVVLVFDLFLFWRFLKIEVLFWNKRFTPKEIQGDNKEIQLWNRFLWCKRTGAVWKVHSWSSTTRYYKRYCSQAWTNCVATPDLNPIANICTHTGWQKIWGHRPVVWSNQKWMELRWISTL